MNNVKEFFNSLAENWDQICFHDPKKVAAIIAACGIKEGDRILDIACGTGVLFEEILQYNPCKLVGVDLAEQMIHQASMKFPDEPIQLRAEDIFNVKDEQFDVAIIYSAYPHFDDKDKLLRHVASLLKDNGRIMIAHSQSKETINGHHDDHAADVSTGLIAAPEEAKRLAPYFKVDIMVDTPDIYMVSALKN